LVYQGSETSFECEDYADGAYYFKLMAHDPAQGYPSYLFGNNPCHVDSSLTFIPEPPPVPSSLAVPVESGTGFTVTWSRAGGSTKVQLERQYMWTTPPWGPTPPPYGGYYTPQESMVYEGANMRYLESPVTGDDGWFAYRIRSYTLFKGYRIYSSWTDWSSTCNRENSLPGSLGMASVPYGPVTGDFNLTISGAWQATDYIIEEDNDPNFAHARRIYPVLVTPTQEPTRLYTIQGRTDGVYYYRVRGVNSQGLGPWYTVYSAAVVIGNPSLPPTTPMELVVPVGSRNGYYNVTWSGIPGATNYVLEEDVSDSFDSPVQIYSGSQAKSYIANPTEGTYYYRVRAENSLGLSPWTVADNPCRVLHTSAMLTGTTITAHPWFRDIRPDASSVVVFVLSFTGDPDNDIDVDSLRLHARGSADDAGDIALIRLYRDTDGNGEFTPGVDELVKGSGAYDADNGTVTFANLNRTIDAGTSEDWLVVVDFAGTALGGENFQAYLQQYEDVVCADSATGIPVFFTGVPTMGGRITVYYPSTPGTLHVSTASSSPSDETLDSGAEGVVMLAFELVPGDVEDLCVDRLLLTGSGSGDEVQDLLSVRLAWDVNRDGLYTPGLDRDLGVLQAFGANDGVCEFRDLSETVAAGCAVQWLVVYNFADAFDQDADFSVQISSSSDLTAQGLTSGTDVVSQGLPVAGRTVIILSSEEDLPPGDDPPGCMPAARQSPLGALGSALPFLLLACALIALAGRARRQRV
jgi:hypothetical protein